MREDQTESVPVTLARLEGKLDAALAVQQARIDEHARRLDVVDTRLNAHSEDLGDLTRQVAAIPPPAPRVSPWQIAGVLLVGVGLPTSVVLAIAGWLIAQIGGS